MDTEYHDVDLYGESRMEDHLSWSDEESVARLVEARRYGKKSLVVTCGYCNTSHKFVTTSKSAGKWFRTHDCL